MTRGEQVAACAETWIGTPFHWQGRVKGVGCDCKGLVAGVAAELGLAEARAVEALCGDYGDPVDVRRLQAGLARLFDRASEPQPGDVLLIEHNGRPQHLAIYAPRGASGGLRMIEAMNQGPMQVRPFRRAAAQVNSIWRWRDVD